MAGIEQIGCSAELGELVYREYKELFFGNSYFVCVVCLKHGLFGGVDLPLVRRKIIGMRYSPKRGHGKTSLSRAVILSVVLVGGILAYGILKKSGLSAGIASYVNVDMDDFRALRQVEQKDRASMQKSWGGFWINQTTDTTAPIQKKECRELRDNGILWEVVSWVVRYPSGLRKTYYHARTCYVNPYALAPEKRGVVCDVRTIRQVYITETDTCYGESQVDEQWVTRKEDTQLIMNRKRFIPYQGDIYTFFPDGMIDLVDKLLLQECPTGASLGGLVTTQMEQEYGNRSLFSRFDEKQLTILMDEYFKPAVVDEMFAVMPFFAIVPQTVSVNLTVLAHGNVKASLTGMKKIMVGNYEVYLIRALDAWKLPNFNEQGNATFHYTVTVPAP